MMQKSQKPLNAPHHKCQICHNQQLNAQCALADVAAYSAETGNLAMVSRLACKKCRQQISTIRQFVQENNLSFGKNSTLFRQNIQPVLYKKEQSQNPIIGLQITDYHSSLYASSIQQQIKRSKLYHCTKLPQNCLQLVYYSSLSINHAQRHQRVKNTIALIMKLAPVNFGNLEDISILVHVLSCYMHEDMIIHIVTRIAQKFILQGTGSPQTSSNGADSIVEKDKQNSLQIPSDSIWKQLYTGYYIGNILLVLGQILKNWKSFQLVLQKVRQHHGYLRKQKLIKMIQNSVNQIPSTVHQSPRKSIINQKQQECCLKCQAFRLKNIYSKTRFKNVLSLILRQLLKQDAAHREHVQQIQLKFSKQKQQFINKIIKLKDKISLLENQQNQQEKSSLRRARSVTDGYIKNVYKPDLESVSEKSEGTSRTNQFRNQQHNSKIQQLDKQRQKQNLGYMHRIVIHIPQFDPSMLSSQMNQKDLTDTIQKSLVNMKQNLQKLQKKSRSFENESKRLLSILTRKQQRFVPLIHEKDEIIQKYQNALWRMQHGMIVQDPALAPRIFNIINVFKNDFMESMSNGTLESDRNIEQIGPTSSSTPSKSKTAAKKKNKQKQKTRQKTQQKLVEKPQKQCAIF